jgi:hypothetical protein
MNNEAQQIKETLESKGIPTSAAERAAKVLVKDDASLPNLGRSQQDQKDISDAWQWLEAKRRGVTE